MGLLRMICVYVMIVLVSSGMRGLEQNYSASSAAFFIFEDAMTAAYASARTLPTMAAPDASPSVEDFGSNGYVYVRGDLQRYQTKRVRTVLPKDDESNAQFELRMHGLALQLLNRPEIYSVSTDLDMVNGAIARCTITIVEAPRPAPIAPDHRPAGGRWSARGARGSGRGRG